MSGKAGIIWERFSENRLSVAAAGVVIVLALAAAFAPLISPYKPSAIHVNSVLAAPSLAHPMGTDELGRDVL